MPAYTRWSAYCPVGSCKHGTSRTLGSTLVSQHAAEAIVVNHLHASSYHGLTQNEARAAVEDNPDCVQTAEEEWSDEDAARHQQAEAQEEQDAREPKHAGSSSHDRRSRSNRDRRRQRSRSRKEHRGDRGVRSSGSSWRPTEPSHPPKGWGKSKGSGKMVVHGKSGPLDEQTRGHMQAVMGFTRGVTTAKDALQVSASTARQCAVMFEEQAAKLGLVLSDIARNYGINPDDV